MQKKKKREKERERERRGSVSEKKVVTRVKNSVLKEPETDCLAIDGVLSGIPSDREGRGPSRQVDQDR